MNASTSNESTEMDYTSHARPWQSSLDFTEADIAGSLPRFDRLEYHNREMDLGNTFVKVTIRDLGELSEWEETPCTSPVLTPSSSTTSLRTLSGQAELPFKFPINYSASTLRISSSLESQDTISLCPTQAESGGVKDEENVIGPMQQMAPGHGHDSHSENASQERCHLKTESPCQRKQPSIGSYGTRRLVKHRWNPADEIRKAQSRFKRYGKETPVVQIDVQRGVIRVRSVAVETRENLCKIRVTSGTTPESKEEISWWKWLASSLTKQCLGRSEGTDEDMAMGNMPGGFEESDVEGIEKPSVVHTVSG